MILSVSTQSHNVSQWLIACKLKTVKYCVKLHDSWFIDIVEVSMTFLIY